MKESKMGLIIAGKAACTRLQLEDRISKGFKHVELITFENQFRDNVMQLKDIIVDYLGSLDYVSIHMPSGLTISHATDKAHRKFAISSLQKLIVLAAQINCVRIVFHGFHHVTRIGSPNQMISLRDKAHKNCIASVKSIERSSREYGVRVCLENINAHICLHGQELYLLYSASPIDLIKAVDEIRSEYFGLCFDSAHALNFCNFLHKETSNRLFDIKELSVEKFFSMISDNVDIVHISDAVGSLGGLAETEHLPIGSGEINFKELLKVILDKGYEGPIVVEPREQNNNKATHMMKDKECLLEIISAYKES